VFKDTTGVVVLKTSTAVWELPSVLWHCWLGIRKSIWPVKKLSDEMLEWLVLVTCLKQGTNDVHIVQLIPLPPHRLLLHWNPDWFNLSGAGLPRLSWKRGR